MEYIIMDGDKEVSVTEEVFNEYLDKLEAEKTIRLKEVTNNTKRIQELQDKAVLEGLTEEEKQEYKELKGVK